MSLYSIKVRFTCFCGGEFQYVDQFIEHKILKHKIEFQQIKSIVFEENVNVIQNGPLPSKSAGTGTGTTTTEAGTGAEAENEEVTTPTPTPILLAHEKFFKRRRDDNLDSEIQNRLTNIGIAVSNSNIEYNFLTSRVSAEAQQQQPDPAPVVPLNNQPDRTLDFPIKQESQFSIDIDGEEYQDNSFDTEPGPCPTTGNQGNDDLDPLDPDPGIEQSNIKCDIEEFEFKNENASDSTTDASSASNLRFVDDAPNITSASASADSLSQSSHYTPDVGVPWGLVPVPVPDEQASEQVSSYPSSSLLHPVPFEMSGPGPGLGPSYNNLQNLNAYTTDVNGDNNRHFRFPVSHSNFNTVSVPVQNFNESLLKTFYARNNNYRNRPGLSEAHTPVESSARIGKKSLRQSGIGGTQVIRSTHRMYRCHVANCSSSFKSAYNLRYHIKCKHTDNYLKNVSCVICDKRFFSRGELNKHSVVHTNDRPFHCPFEGCTSAYKRKNKLTQHLRNNHTNNQMH